MWKREIVYLALSENRISQKPLFHCYFPFFKIAILGVAPFQMHSYCICVEILFEPPVSFGRTGFDQGPMCFNSPWFKEAMSALVNFSRWWNQTVVNWFCQISSWCLLFCEDAQVAIQLGQITDGSCPATVVRQLGGTARGYGWGCIIFCWIAGFLGILRGLLGILVNQLYLLGFKHLSPGEKTSFQPTMCQLKRSPWRLLDPKRLRDGWVPLLDWPQVGKPKSSLHQNHQRIQNLLCNRVTDITWEHSWNRIMLPFWTVVGRKPVEPCGTTMPPKAVATWWMRKVAWITNLTQGTVFAYLFFMLVKQLKLPILLSLYYIILLSLWLHYIIIIIIIIISIYIYIYVCIYTYITIYIYIHIHNNHNNNIVISITT